MLITIKTHLCCHQIFAISRSIHEVTSFLWYHVKQFRFLPDIKMNKADWLTDWWTDKQTDDHLQSLDLSCLAINLPYVEILHSFFVCFVLFPVFISKVRTSCTIIQCNPSNFKRPWKFHTPSDLSYQPDCQVSHVTQRSQPHAPFLKTNKNVQLNVTRTNTEGD